MEKKKNTVDCSKSDEYCSNFFNAQNPKIVFKDFRTATLLEDQLNDVHQLEKQESENEEKNNLEIGVNKIDQNPSDLFNNFAIMKDKNDKSSKLVNIEERNDKYWIDFYKLKRPLLVLKGCQTEQLVSTINDKASNEISIDTSLIENQIIGKKSSKEQCLLEEHSLLSEDKFEQLLKDFTLIQKSEKDLKLLLQDHENSLMDQIEENQNLKVHYNNEKILFLKKIEDIEFENNKLIDDIGLLKDELREKEKTKNDLIRAVALNNKLMKCNNDFESEISRLEKDLNFLLKEKKGMIDTVRQIVFNSSNFSMLNEGIASISSSKKGCLIPGCNGKGHINGNNSSHRMYLFNN